MALTAAFSRVVAFNAKAADSRERKTSRVAEKGRRGLLFSTMIAVAQVTDSKTELLNKYLKKSEENKAKNDKERLDSYYKRNYKDYFGLLEGSIKSKGDRLSESEKGILDWLERNK